MIASIMRKAVPRRAQRPMRRAADADPGAEGAGTGGRKDALIRERRARAPDQVTGRSDSSFAEQVEALLEELLVASRGKPKRGNDSVNEPLPTRISALPFEMASSVAKRS